MIAVTTVAPRITPKITPPKINLQVPPEVYRVFSLLR